MRKPKPGKGKNSKKRATSQAPIKPENDAAAKSPRALPPRYSLGQRRKSLRIPVYHGRPKKTPMTSRPSVVVNCKVRFGRASGF
jgi:hypothetical protein